MNPLRPRRGKLREPTGGVGEYLRARRRCDQPQDAQSVLDGPFQGSEPLDQWHLLLLSLAMGSTEWGAVRSAREKGGRGCQEAAAAALESGPPP